jgi:hypothetical protein
MLLKKKYPCKTEDHVDIDQVLETCMAEIGTHQDINWIVDTGVSNYVMRNKSLVSNMKKCPIATNIRTANGAILPVAGKDFVTLFENKVAEQVLYVPGVCKNLLFVGSFADRGNLILFDAKKFFIFDRHKRLYLIGSPDSKNSLYKLDSLLAKRKQSIKVNMNLID